MHLFHEYIQPLTSWLYEHPHLALLTTFLVSFAESLAIIGSIIPGTVTMTAIGMLAGAGVMRIDLTFIAAMVGATAGDGASYALGYIYSDRLTHIWPFRSYPNLVNYGKVFFERHGASSVLIGRFVGPMRSLIPVIAGMMRMNRWHFVLANAVSAVGWSILYVLPGVLIGAASTELSTEGATRLFIVIMLSLIILWLTSLAVKWLLIHTNQFLRIKLHHFWIWLIHRPHIAYYCLLLTPKHEKKHYPTAALVLLFLGCFLISIIMIALVLQGSWVAAINNPVYLFLQSLRTQPFDSFFIVINLLFCSIPLFSLIAAVTFFTFYYHDWRALRYWLSLVCTSSIVVYLLTRLVKVPQPNRLLLHPTIPTFPCLNLALATSLFSFFIFYINKHYQTMTLFTLRLLLLILLVLGGIAPLYLGDNWITSIFGSYFIGLTLCLFHWILYRRKEPHGPCSQIPIFLTCVLIACATAVSYSLYYKKLVRAHNPYLEQYIMTHQIWWNQQVPLLPIYSTNRFGQRVSLFNIQYAGSLKTLQKSLELHGWKLQSNSLFNTLIKHAGGLNSSKELPQITQLYLNKKPSVVMTYHSDYNQIGLVLSLWRSNYHLRHYHHPIWLGNVQQNPLATKTDSLNSASSLPKNRQYHNPIMQSLQGFQFNQVILPSQYIHPLPHPIPPVILIIKEPAYEEMTHQ